MRDSSSDARLVAEVPFLAVAVLVRRRAAVLVAAADRENLAYAPTVGRFDREGQAVDLDPIARCRHASDPVVDEPTDRVVLVLVLEAEVRVEQLGQVVDGRSPVEPRLVIGEADDHRLLDVVLVLDLADDLLEEVLDRDEAGRPAVLIEDDREVDLPALELVQEVVDRHRLGDIDGRPKERPEVRSGAGRFAQERQEILGVEDPEDLVDRLVVDRDTAVAVLHDRLDRLVERRRRLDGRHRDPRHHHLVDATAAELDDRVDHLLFLGLEDALLPPPLDDEAKLLGGDLRLVRDIRPEHLRDRTRDAGQQGDQRREGPREELDRQRQRDRDTLGVGEGEGLRDELGEDDREQREQDRDDDEGDALGAAAGDRRDEKPEALDEADRRVGGGEEADDGQPELRDGEEPARLVEEAANAPGPRPALVDELLDAASADRHEGDLPGDEEALQECQEDDDEQLTQREVHGAITWRTRRSRVSGAARESLPERRPRASPTERPS